MPEGPSIILIKENASQFAGKKIISAEGTTTIDLDRLLNQKIIGFESWGKHFLICFKDFTVRLHFLLFGSYLINEKNDRPVRLHLGFKNGEINFYATAVKILEGSPGEHYDFSADVMSEKWSAKKAMAKLKAVPEKQQICDTLLDQQIFSGVGNIIKSEVLYRTKVHPESLTSKIPAVVIRKIVKEARKYSFEFLKWKREHTLRQHWLAYTKKKCSICELPMHKKITGKGQRRSFFCKNCQKNYK